MSRQRRLLKANGDQRRNRISMSISNVMRAMCPSNGSDVCVASVVQSICNERNSKREVNGRAMDHAGTTEKLMAINSVKRHFDRDSYRKRRKRIFSSPSTPIRRPVRSCRLSLDTDHISASVSRQAPSHCNGPIETESKRTQNVQIHDSVFSPDLCRLMKTSKCYSDLTAGRSSMALCWHISLNDKLLPHLARLEREEAVGVAEWTVDDVARFVRALPACPPAVAEKFLEEQIDGKALLLLTQRDIVNLLNIRFGPAVKIHNAILLLKHKMLIE